MDASARKAQEGRSTLESGLERGGETGDDQGKLEPLRDLVGSVHKVITGSGDKKEAMRDVMDNLGALTSAFHHILDRLIDELGGKSKNASKEAEAEPDSDEGADDTSSDSVGLKKNREKSNALSSVETAKVESSIESIDEKITLSEEEAFVIGDSTGNGLANLRPDIQRQAFGGMRASQFMAKLENDQFREEFEAFANSSKVVILNFGGNEATSDRWASQTVKNQNEIIDALLAANPNLRIIVVARPGYPKDFTPREEITANMPQNSRDINIKKLNRWKSYPNVIVVSCDSMNEGDHLNPDYVRSQNDPHLNEDGLREVWRLIERDGNIEFI